MGEHVPGYLYPQTTEVKGYCNAAENLMDESSWVWTDCDKEDEPNFADLWYATRGGGGGTYGVVTSMYYQLHDLPPADFQFFLPSIAVPPEMAKDTQVVRQWWDFYFRFLYIPESVNVTRSASSYCSGPDDGLLCWNSGLDVFAAAWKRYSNDLFPLDFVGLPSKDLRLFFAVEGRYPGNPNFPDDRVPDDPHAFASQLLWPGSIVFPLDVLENKLDAFLDVLVPFIIDTGFVPTPYEQGGNIPYASDGMTSYPPHRRNAAFHMNMPDDVDFVHELLRIFFYDDDEKDDGNYPGLL